MSHIATRRALSGAGFGGKVVPETARRTGDDNTFTV